jgi:hypothetical protein
MVQRLKMIGQLLTEAAQTALFFWSDDFRVRRPIVGLGNLESIITQW